MGLEQTGDPGVWRLLCTVPAAPQRHTSSPSIVSLSPSALPSVQIPLSSLILFQHCTLGGGMTDGTGAIFLFAICTACHSTVSKTVDGHANNSNDITETTLSEQPVS